MYHIWDSTAIATKYNSFFSGPGSQVNVDVIHVLNLMLVQQNSMSIQIISNCYYIQGSLMSSEDLTTTSEDAAISYQ